MNYNIYTFSFTEKRWLQTCSVEENQVSWLKPQISVSLQRLVEKTCTMIIGYENLGETSDISNDRIKVENNLHKDKMDFTFVKKFLYRRGSIYFGVQYSYQTNQTRIICLGTDKIHHSGMSFSTNPIETVTMEEIKNDILSLDLEDIIKNYDICPESKQNLNTGNYIIGI